MVLDFYTEDTVILHKATMLMVDLNEKFEELIEEDIEEIEITERYSNENVCTIHYLKDLLTETAKVIDSLEADLGCSVDDIEFELR